MAFVWMDILFVELGFCGWDGAEPRHHTGPVGGSSFYRRQCVRRAA